MKELLVFVSLIDEALIGKTLCGYRFDKVLIYDGIYDTIEKNRVKFWAEVTFVPFENIPNADRSFIRQNDEGCYVNYFVKETNEDTLVVDIEDAIRFMQLLSIYKDSSISFSDINIISLDKEDDHKTINRYAMMKYKCTAGNKLFNLVPDEKKDFESLFGNLKSISNSKTIFRMIDVYMSGRSIYLPEAKEVLFITVMEMLTTNPGEITYRLGRSVAVLLGKDVEDSKLIYEEFKQLYQARSRYVHNGSIEEAVNSVEKAQELARKTILEIINISLNTNKSIKEISDELTYLAFGQGESLY